MTQQTILGSGGAIGTELAKALTGYTSKIRLVSRRPVKVNDHDELHAADLSKRESVFEAIKGSDIVYVTIGFPYKLKVWGTYWPEFIRNVLDACKVHKAKLVFFDNVYALDPAHLNQIKENTPKNPCSKKGTIRAEVDQMIEDAIAEKRVEAIIARSPDFFSDKKDNSIMMNLVYDNLIKGKKAQWMCDIHKVHSMGYAPDLAKGTAILGNTADAYGQIWNLPVSAEKLDGDGWIKLFATELGTSDAYQVLPNWLIKALGIFIPVMREIPEMNYQFERDYFFDSSKFNERFQYSPSSNHDAVKEVIHKLSKTKAPKT